MIQFEVELLHTGRNFAVNRFSDLKVCRGDIRHLLIHGMPFTAAVFKFSVGDNPAGTGSGNVCLGSGLRKQNHTGRGRKSYVRYAVQIPDDMLGKIINPVILLSLGSGGR